MDRRVGSARIWRATATNAPPQAPPSGKMRAKTSRRARPQAQPRRGALLHDLAAEAEQRRRPPPGRGRGFAGRLDQGRGFNQAAEILLVQVAPRDRLHGALQLGEGELARQRGFAAAAARFLDQAGLVDELVAVEHLLLVPRAAAERETQAHALAPAQRTRRRGLGRAARPILEQRQDDLVEDVRPLFPPIFPREEAIPWFEAGAGRTQGGEILRHAREREIADRDDVGAGIARPRVAAAIAEGVELLDVADRKAGLGLTQARSPISKVRCASGSNGPNGSPARVSPLAASPATRMAGSSPSIVTIAAVSPISIGVSGASVMGEV